MALVLNALPTTPHQPSQATSTRTHNGLPQMKSDLWRNFKLREKYVHLSLLLTFPKVDHAILPPLRSLVFYRETDLLPDQFLPKELPSRKCPGLKDKQMCHLGTAQFPTMVSIQATSFLQYPGPTLGPKENIKMKCIQHRLNTQKTSCWFNQHRL